MLRHVLALAVWAPTLLRAVPLQAEGLEAGCQAPACRAGSEELASMLQRAVASAALGQDRQQRRREGSDLAASLERISPTQRFRGVTMLYLRLPLSEEVMEQGLKGTLFGGVADPEHGGFVLDAPGTAQVILAHYPDAQIGWTGAFGASTPVNIPHHLISVRLPMRRGAQRLYQTVYAFTNDDIAMMLYRMGHGIPAKLANISFSLDSSFPKAQAVGASRRGRELLSAYNLQDRGAAELTAVEELFNRPELNFGTEQHNLLALSGAVPDLVFKKRVTEARVHAARRVDVGFSAFDGEFEHFRGLFSSLEPLEAYWLRADLHVTTSLVAMPAHPVRSWNISEVMWPNLTEWRMMGEVVTGKRGRTGVPKMAYQNGDVIWMKMKVSAEKVAPYLPPGLTAEAGEGTIWHVRWQPGDVMNMWGSINATGDYFDLEYNELWITVPVSFHGRRYLYPILMLLDEDVGEIGGHDGLGCPKKLGNLTFTFSPRPGADSWVHLDVSRRGRQVLQVSGHISERRQQPVVGVNADVPGSDIVWALYQQFPWDPAVDRPRLLATSPVERTHDQREMRDIRVSLGSSVEEPLAEWFEGHPTAGGYVKMDQDWVGSSPSTPAAWQLEPIEADKFAPWWKRVFPLLFM